MYYGLDDLVVPWSSCNISCLEGRDDLELLHTSRDMWRSVASLDSPLLSVALETEATSSREEELRFKQQTTARKSAILSSLEQSYTQLQDVGQTCIAFSKRLKRVHRNWLLQTNILDCFVSTEEASTSIGDCLNPLSVVPICESSSYGEFQEVERPVSHTSLIPICTPAVTPTLSGLTATRDRKRPCLMTLEEQELTGCSSSDYSMFTRCGYQSSVDLRDGDLSSSLSPVMSSHLSDWTLTTSLSSDEYIPSSRSTTSTSPTSSRSSYGRLP